MELIQENLDLHGLSRDFLNRVSFQDRPLTNLPFDDDF
jgi:hypothetical protein